MESIRFAYDNDEAGERAFFWDAERVIAHGLEAHRIKFRFGWDANSTALEQGGEALRQAVRNAIWYGKSSPKPEKSEETSTKVASSLAASDGSETVAKKEEAHPPQPVLERKGDYHEMPFGERLYRVGGLEKNNSLEVLRITLRLSCQGLMHVDSLHLYRDGERRKFIDRAAEETLLEKDLLKRDLGKLLLALEQAQEARLNQSELETEHFELSPEEESEALAFLRAPNLLDRIARAYDEAGIVGEQTNLLAAYLACASRKLAKPLAVIIQSTSAAGKSTLMEAV